MLDQGIHKQPIYLLLNTSTANKENLDSWLNCIRLLVDTLRKSAYESMSIHLSLAGFDSSVNTLHPLTPISSFRIPEISCGEGQMWLGAAMVGLKSLIVQDRLHYPDCVFKKPIAFIFTDKDLEEDIKGEMSAYKKGAGNNLHICTSKEGKSNKTYAKISKMIVSVEEFDENFIRTAMTWLSGSIIKDVETFNIETDFKDASIVRSHCRSFEGIGLRKTLKSEESMPQKRKPVTYEASYPEDALTNRMNVEELERMKEEELRNLAFEKAKSARLTRYSRDGEFSSYAGGLSGCLLMGFMVTPSGPENEIREIEERIRAIEEEISKAHEDVADMVYSSVFAPAEVKRRSRMVTQIYLHLHEEADTVCSLAKESLKRAERRDYIPLSVKLNKGDKVDIDFQIYGEDLLMSERKSVIWQGTFTKCSFSYFVPENIDIDELYCEAHLTINSAMVGEISFTTEIVESPRRIKPEIHSHQFKRIFISYAHADAEFVKGLALAYKFQGVDYFYDRDNINAGDIYEELIYEYIDSADLFILCWSQNAAASEYVDKERRRALSHAYPQKSVREATLKICPVSIAPKADLPDDMSSIYHFESIV